ncbi:MAG: HAD-IA family hydrolase, partial [Candidatus Bathyarchaeia archaeon]
MHPDVAETLLKLKKLELKLGLVSTGYEEDIHTIFEKINLQRELFDVIIGVNTIKKEKPHPEVFRYALAKLNVEPSQALFVGDN